VTPNVPRTVGGDNRHAPDRREADVLDLVRRGLTNAQIGERLYISPRTAEHDVSSVLGKLGVRSRAEAAALSILAGI
jgi:DNA-binding NarL/FixJ family response regulator